MGEGGISSSICLITGVHSLTVLLEEIEAPATSEWWSSSPHFPMKISFVLIGISLVILSAACQPNQLSENPAPHLAHEFAPTPPVGLPVGTIPQGPVYIQNPITLKVGEAFTPLSSITGGSGAGNYQFWVGGYANWPGAEGVGEGAKARCWIPKTCCAIHAPRQKCRVIPRHSLIGPGEREMPTRSWILF